MTPQQIADAIDEIDTTDPESAHSALDGFLLIAAPVEVQQAAGRVYARAKWWATA